MGWRVDAAAAPASDPDDSKVADGIFANSYFNLSYPLLPGWREGLAGPAPSVSGYYVLATFIPKGELTGTMMVAAQDMFFATKPIDDLMAMAAEFGRSISQVDGMTIDRAPSLLPIGGRSFSRVDFSGVGLFRSTLTTKIRCHFVSFNLTAKSPELLAVMLHSLDNLGPVRDRDTARPDPMCIGDYAVAAHVMHRVDPAAVVPTFVPIPVRIVVGGNGAVEHVHVIRATNGQRDSIERALAQWKLKPDEIDGRPTEIETGLVLKFTPTGSVKYSTGSRTPKSDRS